MLLHWYRSLRAIWFHVALLVLVFMAITGSKAFQYPLLPSCHHGKLASGSSSSMVTSSSFLTPTTNGSLRGDCLSIGLKYQQSNRRRTTLSSKLRSSTKLKANYQPSEGISKVSPPSSPSTSPADDPNFPPPPPWRFTASHIDYQFLAIPTDLGRKYCPPTQPCNDRPTNNNDDKNGSPESLLTLMGWDGGYTLGGVFTVEYTSSPIGPYREVAVLSSLVARFPSIRKSKRRKFSFDFGGIGAWASHIFVDSHDAAKYGRQHWGLPATVLPIEFKSTERTATNTVDRNDSVAANFTPDRIQIAGWNPPFATKKDSTFAKMSNGIDISLPSFSGCLALSSTEINDFPLVGTSTTPLLQYPLRIQKPQRFSLNLEWPSRSKLEDGNGSFTFERFTKNIEDAEVGSTERILSEIEELLSQSIPLGYVGISNVQLEAGIPTEIQ